MKAICFLIVVVLAFTAQAITPKQLMSDFSKLKNLRPTIQEQELFEFSDIQNAINQVFSELGDVANMFGQCAQSWQEVNWQTGDGMVNAIQATASTLKTIADAINNANGGAGNTQEAMDAVAKIAGKACPPLGVAIKAGKVMLNVSGQAIDITDLAMGISKNIKSANFPQAAIDGIQLCQMIVSDIES